MQSDGLLRTYNRFKSRASSTDKRQEITDVLLVGDDQRMTRGPKSRSGFLAGGLGLILCLLSGCTCSGSRVDQALQSGKGISSSPTFVQQNYHLHSPDEFEVRAAGPTPYVEQCRIGPDGRVLLGGRSPLGVEGLKPEEIAIQFAHQLHCKPEQLAVHVTGYHSQQIFIFGEIPGLQRAVEYHGPETVSELLQRIGGLSADAAPGDVQVVRSHVADGRPPEVFDVNLAAIVLNNDNQTNVRLQPFDQVYIGQTLQGRMCRCLPPWLRPLFEQLCGMRRHIDKSALPPGTSPRVDGHPDPILPTASKALQ